jgi:gamma-glutamylcyclotransferase (GGCT)/AIG2-like uncharacterized protein YtfP
MKKGDLLLVYGTLRQGERADITKKMPGAVSFVSLDRITGEMYNMGYYPGVKAEAGSFEKDKPAVVGEIYQIDNPSIIPILDGYEGYPSLYNRIETETEGGRVTWVYTFNHEVLEEQRIPSGDWANRPAIHQRVRA